MIRFFEEYMGSYNPFEDQAGRRTTTAGRTAYKELRKILCSSHPLSSNGLYEPIYSSKNRIINLPPHNNGTT